MQRDICLTDKEYKLECLAKWERTKWERGLFVYICKVKQRIWLPTNKHKLTEIQSGGFFFFCKISVIVLVK